MKSKHLFFAVFSFAFLFLAACNDEENPNEEENKPLNISCPYFTFTAEHGLKDNYLTAIEVDSLNRIWVGYTDEGVSVYEDSVWKHFTTFHGLVTNSISDIKAGIDGTIWIGGTGGVSAYKDGVFTNYTEQNGLYYLGVYSLHVDRADNLWIGLGKNHLQRLDSDSLTDFVVNAAGSNNGQIGHIHAICDDDEGNIWVGSCKTGLSVLNGTDWADGVNDLDMFVRSLVFSTDGDVWCGSYRGLDRFHQDAWENITDKNIISIAVCKDGGLVFACDTTIRMYQGNQVLDVYSSNSGVKDMAFDKDGNLWATTGNGVLRICKSHLDGLR